MNQLFVHEYYCHKAETELDLPQEPIESAIKEAIEWFFGRKKSDK